jgi:DNA-binding NarL/FixJ family response regulator
MARPGGQPARAAVRAGYPAVRAGLAALLREQGIEVVEEAHAGPGEVHVLLLDRAAEEAPEPGEHAVPAIVLVDPAAVLPYGAAGPGGRPRPGGWLSREADGPTLAAAVEAAAAGLAVFDPPLRVGAPGEDLADGAEAHLTPRELAVLQRIAAGLTNKAIARALTISEHTAKSHVGASSRNSGCGRGRRR